MELWVAALDTSFGESQLHMGKITCKETKKFYVVTRRHPSYHLSYHLSVYNGRRIPKDGMVIDDYHPQAFGLTQEEAQARLIDLHTQRVNRAKIDLACTERNLLAAKSAPSIHGDEG